MRDQALAANLALADSAIVFGDACEERRSADLLHDLFQPRDARLLDDERLAAS